MQFAVKLYDNRLPKAVRNYLQEKKCLLALRQCPGVVHLEAAGRLQDSLYPCICTVFAGSPSKHLSRQQRVTAKQAIEHMHAAGAAHGDIWHSNFIFDHDGSCRLADLAACTLQASQEKMIQDLQQLKHLG